MQPFLLLAIFIMFSFPVNAQSPVTGSVNLKSNYADDTTSLSHAFKSGRIKGYFRYFFMTTQNEKGLADYVANAAGVSLRFETARFQGFQLALSGAVTYNVGSPGLTKADAATGQNNRYEIALYDVEDPAKKSNLNLLEEFYLKYNYKNSAITIGRQLINTPFINAQDGRMRPGAVQAVWAEFNQIKKIKIEAGWLNAFSPRGTTKWYSTGESIGILPTGVNSEGSVSGYKANVKSKGIAILGITANIHKNIKLQGWNMFTEHVFNTTMIQSDLSLPLKKNRKLFLAAQIIQQTSLNSGGNNDQAKTYFQKGGHSLSFGSSVGWKNKLWEISFNYNRVTKSGRYLMPREWGKEPFFTFLPRERNEGSGDVHAFMTKIIYTKYKGKFLPSLAEGFYQLPDVKDYRLNKYGMPSYVQVNADIRYNFTKHLNGLEAEFLFVDKVNCGESYNNEKFIFNKVNMQQYNFVLNYRF